MSLEVRRKLRLRDLKLETNQFCQISEQTKLNVCNRQQETAIFFWLQAMFVSPIHLSLSMLVTAFSDHSVWDSQYNMFVQS